MQISLIVATLGRKAEVASLLESLCHQTIPPSKIEVIIVDQNPQGYLKDIIDLYQHKIKVLYKHSNRLGLSLNRNIGLDLANGEIIGFPDDDCCYLPETLNEVLNAFKKTNASLVLGKLVDPITREDAIKKWPTKSRRLHKFNFYKCSSSATMFTRKSSIRFDEEFGVGARWGSNEDAIYIYQHIKKNLNCTYNPNVVVLHPDQKYQDLNMSKIWAYGYGYGKFIRKYLSLSLLYFFLASATYQLFFAAYALFHREPSIAKKRILSFSSRILGFLKKT
jgi:glycosyltransferase involved in cell wall biosynthesis